MGDEELRRLERRVREGVPGARLAYARALVRSGKSLTEAWSGLALELGFDALAPVALVPSSSNTARGERRVELGKDVLETLEADLLHLDGEELLAQFPKDDRGRLELREIVLLASYPSPYQDGRGKLVDAWLVATAPTRRREAQVVTLRLYVLPLRGATDPHRWHEARWLWDTRCEPAEELVYGARLTPKMRRAMRLLDEGAFVDAFALFSVRLSRRLQQRLARGSGSEKLSENLRVCAPWRLRALVAARRAAKSHALIRFFPLPGGSGHRRPALVLDEDRGELFLDVVESASDARVAETSWKRPDERTLARLSKT